MGKQIELNWGEAFMTMAYSQRDSAYLAYIKQVAMVAVIKKVVTWKDLDEYELDVLRNNKGLDGLAPTSKEFIKKIENFMSQYADKAC